MLTLHQFPFSHFNEKARWALDFKGIPHERVNYLPGPHAGTIKRLSGGPTTTPLLETEDGYISGSAEIIDYLERHFEEPSLYPDDSVLHEDALRVQQRFDAEVGPATRTAAFSIFINEPAYLCQTFASGKPLLKRIGYRAMLPMVKPLIRKANGVTPDNIERSFQMVRETLDDVAERTHGSGFMVGDAFSVADLTAASLLAPLADLEHPDMKRPDPMPRAFAEFLGEWRGHDAIAWVKEMYRRFRPMRP